MCAGEDEGWMEESKGYRETSNDYCRRILLCSVQDTFFLFSSFSFGSLFIFYSFHFRATFFACLHVFLLPLLFFSLGFFLLLLSSLLDKFFLYSALRLLLQLECLVRRLYGISKIE